MTTQTQRLNKQIEEVLEAALTCTHHWVLEAATDPTSMGTCRGCGETNEFANYIEPPEVNERSWISFGSMSGRYYD
jgi:hypothetical protein